MAFLASLAGPALGIAGSLFGAHAGAKGQEAAAQQSADAQLKLQHNQQQEIQRQEAAYRAQIQKMIPFLGGPSDAAGRIRNSFHYLSPGQGSMFGGQQLGSDGSPAGMGQPPPPPQPQPPNYLVQQMPQNTSGVPMFHGIEPGKGGVQSFPGYSGHAVPSPQYNAPGQYRGLQ